MQEKFIDLTGNKFGRLIVIKRVPNDEWRHAMWLCKCDCGREKAIAGANLRNGRTQSCGCLQKKITGNIRRLNSGLANMHQVIRDYKSNAKKRGIEYNLTEEQFKKITQKDCYYCGAKPNNKKEKPQSFGQYIYNGIDRINNTKGYLVDNVVPCCKTCNTAKGTKTLQEFKDWIEKIYKNYLPEGN